MTTVKYQWQAYTDPCNVRGFFADPAHDPPHWEENLAGPEKVRALKILEADRAEAERTNRYNQKTIGPEDRIFLRTSTASGHSWEVRLDDEDKPRPNPCEDEQPMPLEPKDFAILIRGGSLQFSREDKEFELVLKALQIAGGTQV